MFRENLESVLKPFKIHSLDDGKFSCVLEFLLGRKVFGTNWFWDAISGVKYQTLFSRPFSQGAMWRVCIIRQSARKVDELCKEILNIHGKFGTNVSNLYMIWRITSWLYITAIFFEFKPKLFAWTNYVDKL